MSLILWIFYYPLIKILSFPIFWLPEFQERVRFEKKNLSDPLSASFNEVSSRADMCFEFSSEGEYQQVASLIHDALELGKKVELVFFSPSVEKTIQDLGELYPDQIRYQRYPLLAISPFNPRSSFSRWVTSHKLIMVRYDLFPEFLLWSKHKNHELSMVWMTFKKERMKNKNISWLKKAFLNTAHHIVYASNEDQKEGEGFAKAGISYDFRMEQIRRRVSAREKKFQSIFPQYATLKKILESYPRNKRLIIGNAWPSDLFLLKDLPPDFFVLIVPHQLTPEILRAFHLGLEKLDRVVVEVAQEREVNNGDTFILNKKGVLCELYSDFGKAYVGGGFEVGVHSLLEPLVAGCDQLAAGPRNERSTEFDVAQSYGSLKQVNCSEDFSLWLNQPQIAGPRTLSQVFEKYQKYRKEVISC